jgi:hypothetical protein
VTCPSMSCRGASREGSRAWGDAATPAMTCAVVTDQCPPLPIIAHRPAPPVRPTGEHGDQATAPRRKHRGTVGAGGRLSIGRAMASADGQETRRTL